MRRSSLAVLALVVLPLGLSAQVRVPPRVHVGRPTTPPPADLPPAAPVVAREMALQRSHWSGEGYTLITVAQMPGPTGGTSRVATLGTGARATYRVNDRLFTTLDMTAGILGGSGNVTTAEAGMRYSLGDLDKTFRPFVDARAGYIRMTDLFTSTIDVGGAGQSVAVDGTRYSRGFGGVTGVGFEYSLTNSLSVSTEVMALGDQMTVYSMRGAQLPTGRGYWMTSFRYTIGLRFNPTRALQLVQNPRS